MNLRSLFKHVVPVEKTTTPVSGITMSDWTTIYNSIQREYNATAEQHKKPTEYMRGLKFALNVLDSIRPYNIAEV